MRKMKGNGFKKYVEERAVNLKEDLHYIFFFPVVLETNLYIRFTTKAHSFAVMKGKQP